MNTEGEWNVLVQEYLEHVLGTILHNLMLTAMIMLLTQDKNVSTFTHMEYVNINHVDIGYQYWIVGIPFEA